MKNLETIEFGVQSLDNHELKQVDGGALFVAGLILGAAAMYLYTELTD